MTIVELAAIVSTIATVITAVTVVIGYMNFRSNKIERTRDLYIQYFGLTESRHTAWFYLKKQCKSFEEMWNEDDPIDFLHFYKVASFWFLLFNLYKAGEISKPLAKKLFLYDFYYWQAMIHPVLEQTKLKDNNFPEVLSAFHNTNWLGNCKDLQKKNVQPLTKTASTVYSSKINFVWFCAYLTIKARKVRF
jgi:hypothetical protein